MAKSSFKGPLYHGDTEDNYHSPVPFVVTLDTSAGRTRNDVVMPPNSQIISYSPVVMESVAVSGATRQGQIRVGNDASATSYALVNNVSAAGPYSPTLGTVIASVTGTVQCQIVASGDTTGINVLSGKVRHRFLMVERA